MTTEASVLCWSGWRGMPVARKLALPTSDISGELIHNSRYDKETGTGGSNGATMRFPPEGDHGANAGLTAARDFLGPVKGSLLSSVLLHT